MTWQPYREPLRTTLLRTFAIAAVAGTLFVRSVGGMSRWPLAFLLMLWPAFGGHWVEIVFLNWLRPRLPDARAVQVVARLAFWFAGGVLLGIGMGLTADALHVHPARWSALGPPWWIAGVGFIGVELIAHIGLQLCGKPSFYNGRG